MRVLKGDTITFSFSCDVVLRCLSTEVHNTAVMNMWYGQDRENEQPPAEVDNSVALIFFNYLQAQKI